MVRGATLAATHHLARQTGWARLALGAGFALRPRRPSQPGWARRAVLAVLAVLAGSALRAVTAPLASLASSPHCLVWTMGSASGRGLHGALEALQEATRDLRVPVDSDVLREGFLRDSAVAVGDHGFVGHRDHCLWRTPFSLARTRTLIFSG